MDVNIHILFKIVFDCEVRKQAFKFCGTKKKLNQNQYRGVQDSLQWAFGALTPKIRQVAEIKQMQLYSKYGLG